MDYRMLAKSFLKNIPGIGPAHLKALDMLFETKWNKPRFAHPNDFYEMSVGGTENVVRFDGMRDGKRITIIAKSEDAKLITPELRSWLKGGQ